MTLLELRNKKKITKATLNSFIKNATVLYVEKGASFDGQFDCIMPSRDRSLKLIEDKKDAIGYRGVYCVGNGGDYFEIVERKEYYGINVSNSCGNGTILTKK